MIGWGDKPYPSPQPLITMEDKEHVYHVHTQAHKQEVDNMKANTKTPLPDEWTSKNGNWKIHKPDFRAGKWFIENLKTGFGDNPFIHSGRVAYDYPEAIPQYVKNKLCRMAAGML